MGFVPQIYLSIYLSICTCSHVLYALCFCLADSKFLILQYKNSQVCVSFSALIQDFVSLWG